MTLKQATENLYAAFSDLPMPVRLDGCPCCISSDEIDVLLRKSLRELTDVDLSAFAASAPWTVGTWADYSYFFPRLLELSFEQNSLLSADSLLSRLNQGYQFTAEQLQAVQEVVWQRWLQTPLVLDDPLYAPCETVLGCVVLSQLPLQKALKAWLTFTEPLAPFQVASFINCLLPDVLAGQPWNVYLDDELSKSEAVNVRKQKANEEVINWLQTSEVEEYLLRALKHLHFPSPETFPYWLTRNIQEEFLNEALQHIKATGIK